MLHRLIQAPDKFLLSRLDRRTRVEIRTIQGSAYVIKKAFGKGRVKVFAIAGERLGRRWRGLPPHPRVQVGVPWYGPKDLKTSGVTLVSVYRR